ncbi:MAG: site-2 protease family protein, partial [Lachnospiraceae bacterium]|nr:site-2 protease family protein [Lachnospiraceae bacterium]
MATIISFIIVFGVIVLAHELGHFILGKKNGITVVEFF